MKTRSIFLPHPAHAATRIAAIFVGGAIAAFALTPFFARAEVILSTTLGPGSRGPSVVTLQRFLASDPDIYPERLATGFYGSLTQMAVGRFQCNEGIVCNGSPRTNGYGRVGPRTLAAINATARVVGGTPVYDIRAPVMSVEGTTVARNAATISWTTSEPARHRVMYGSAFPFLYATAPSAVDASVDSSASVTLSGLAATTTYFYVRESVDLAGNVMWTTPRTLRTAP